MQTHRFCPRPRLIRTALAAACFFTAAAAQAAPTCYHNYGAINANKPNKLFLYFPTTDDPTFPNYAGLTSPARTFDIALLPNPPAGTTTALRNRIYDVVATDYCEFNVQVMTPTTSNPDALVSPPARRNMVAIGADTNGNSSGVLFGQAEAVDTGDADVIDHSRVWAGSYGVFCGTPGGTLDGANNTLDRWAYGIGGTAAHEAGHNYGLAHSTVLHTGEDPITNHIMPAGGNIPCSDRVGHLRHFSDQDFGILANNVGLTVQSLANWDFINPNAGTATALQMEVLSLSTTLTPVSTYLGSLSPWGVPVVAAAGSKMFKGTSYHRFLVTWNAPKAWTSPNIPGSTAGNVRGGEKFHIGTHFAEENILSTTNQVVIADAVLLNSGGTALALHPRVPSYGTGTLSPSGFFNFNFENLINANLVLKNLQAFVLPRPLHIDALVFNPTGGIDFFDVQGQKVQPWRQVQLASAMELPSGSADKPGHAEFAIGNLLRDGRNVRVKTNADSRDAFGTSEVNRPNNGTLLTDPFPGASVLITGQLIEPGATQWDPEQQIYVSRDLVTNVFVQINGQRAKPVDGNLIGLLRSKVTCANLNTRLSVSAAIDANGYFDCEKSGLISVHGDRVQITQVGTATTNLPAVQLSGMDIGKAVCTNLNTRKSVSFAPKVSTDRLDCVQAGLGIEASQTIQFSQVGTVR